MRTFLMLLLTLIAANAAAGEPHKSRCASEQEIAEELVKRELYGYRLMGERSVCLDQSKFEHVRVDTGGSDEYNEKPVVLESNPKTLVRVQVFKTTILDEPFEEPGDRRADYFLLQDSKERKIGTIYFNLNRVGSPMHKWYGCATVFSPPKKLQVWDVCLRRGGN
ncbi:MAG TPA: hypothetical protein VFV50_19590 [Bdellovibrionales bacterium]|nr:hypothetical protein [Bdellovibrionales bacterium]